MGRGGDGGVKNEGAVPPATEKQMEAKQSHGNVRRRLTDYIWLLVILAGMWAIGDWMGGLSPPEEAEGIQSVFKLLGYYTFGFDGEYGVREWVLTFAAYWAIGAVWMTGMTLAMFAAFRRWYPHDTPTTHFASQLKAILPNNILILPLYQAVWDALMCLGYTKTTCWTRLSLPYIVLDSMTWMLIFEWSWYLHHRAMHDFKPLWKYGHAYHHSWKRPEHMIGVTNFAFDHVVEPWAAMISTVLPSIVMPGNFFVQKVVSLLYMILAVCVHWDYFPMRYHLNHHYLVTKNYGSHWPFFDMLFGTYQWEDYTPPRAKAQ